MSRGYFKMAYTTRGRGRIAVEGEMKRERWHREGSRMKEGIKGGEEEDGKHEENG